MHAYTNYHWRGINAAGEKITGNIQAISLLLAKTALQKSDITVLSIKKNFFTLSIHAHHTLSEKHRLDFTQQLQLLLQAGIPLFDALSLIISTTQHHLIKQIASALKEKISAGESLATALSSLPLHFTPLFCSIVSAGEQSGQLETVLQLLMEDQARHMDIKNKVSKALFYPLCVLCIALIIAAGLLIFVIPQFSAIYSNFGAQLPSMTRYLIILSHALMHQGVFYSVIIVFAMMFLKIGLKKSVLLRKNWDACWFQCPPVRSLTITGHIATWSRLLALTLSCGIPLVDALHIANRALRQPKLSAQMQQVTQAVIEGKSLYAALTRCPYFPLRAKSMIGIAESADAVPSMLQKIAVIYQQQLSDALDRLSKLLEPVIMITVAGFVSGLIIAMYLPIFRMGSIV